MAAVIFIKIMQEISGHGMVMDPINRSSAWRLKFKTPTNNEDNQLFCGGREESFLVIYF